MNLAMSRNPGKDLQSSSVMTTAVAKSKDFAVFSYEIRFKRPQKIGFPELDVAKAIDRH
jgi:hypothetical protein